MKVFGNKEGKISEDEKKSKLEEAERGMSGFVNV